MGNTPTGVGKTCGRGANSGEIKKHPHGRGEDKASHVKPSESVETPPRAWGRQGLAIKATNFLRNTPTGVGKTYLTFAAKQLNQKHPHGRGEDDRISSPSRTMMETPPRAWGRPDSRLLITSSLGNTPTGVGKTLPPSTAIGIPWKHPHGRGEDQVSI